ncbi:hypothetical protein M0R01_02450 [bacterium]|nr:hypothetical protein [bacterium]
MLEKTIKVILITLTSLGLFAIWKSIIDSIGYKDPVFFYQLESATVIFTVLCCTFIFAIATYLKIGTK